MSENSGSTMTSGEENPFLPSIWPAALGPWVDANGDLASRLRASLSELPRTATEKTIWDTLAASHSPEWRDARDALAEAEGRLNILFMPENKPLGSIGKALASTETNEARERRDEALAHFIIIEEALRRDGHLNILFEAVLAHRETVDGSLKMSSSVKTITEKAPPQIPPSPIAAAFRLGAKKLQKAVFGGRGGK